MFTSTTDPHTRSARVAAGSFSVALLLACGGQPDGATPSVSVAAAQTPSTSVFQNATAQALPAGV